MSRVLAATGRWVLDFVHSSGDGTLLFWRSIRSLAYRPWYLHNWLTQMVEIGNRSLPVVIVTAVFSGAVFALQVWQGFEQFGATTLVAFAVALGMTRELIPVLSAIMVAGRAGSAMA